MKFDFRKERLNWMLGVKIWYHFEFYQLPYQHLVLNALEYRESTPKARS